MKKNLLLLAMVLPLFAFRAANRNYYVDSTAGNDANDGLSPQNAWKTLQKAGARTYTEGEHLLLHRGCVFKGKLLVNATGKAEANVVVDAYGDDGKATLPIIDAKGFLAGVEIVDSAYVEIRNLEIMADAGESTEKAADAKRYGVFITAQKAGDYGHITLRSLRIHDIFATTSSPDGGKNPTTSMGLGIESSADAASNAVVNDVLIENCDIEKTGFIGIRLFRSNDVRIVNNSLRAIGGPGIQASTCKNLVVRGNLVDGSGSDVDPRMHGRGSGIWPWSCTDVLIEGNAFMHARGKQDSCGAHIDFNNSNVIVQRNLSLDNEGGFIEILGNDRNCAYRYNISINDGARVKGQNGAVAPGMTLLVSGFVGLRQKPVGPFNSYIYNNTIFLKSDICSNFEVQPSAEGALVANNIFYARGDVEVIDTPWMKKRAAGKKFQNVIFENNTVSKQLPAEIYNSNILERLDDPQFKNPGGFDPADYIPANKTAVKGTGAVIATLPGDSIGLTIGLQPQTDFFGNKIPAGPPDMGAIVFGGELTQMPQFGIPRVP